MGRPDEAGEEMSVPLDPPPPYPFTQEPQQGPSMPMPQPSFPTGPQQQFVMNPGGLMYPVQAQGMGMPLTYIPQQQPFILSPQPQPVVNVSLVNNVGMGNPYPAAAQVPPPTSAEAAIVRPDLYYDKALRLIFARKVFGVLLVQTVLGFLIPSIILANVFVDCPKIITDTSDTSRYSYQYETQTTKPNPCSDYMESNKGLAIASFVFAIILVVVFTFYNSWIQTKWVVFGCFGAIAALVGYSAHVVAVPFAKEFIVLYGTLTAVYFAIVLFTFQSRLDFNVLWAILIVIAGTILGSLIVIPFVQVETFPFLTFSALSISLYFALLIRNMMVNMCRDGCIGCCGCGMNLTKSSEQWPIAVVQLFFCVAIVVLVLAAFVLACICYMFCSDDESKYEVRIRRRRTLF